MARAVRVVFRTAWIMLAAAAVAGMAWLSLGPPSLAREYRVRNEAARFSPTLGHGVMQLLGETLLLVVVAWASRRWLRIRL